MHEYSNIFEYSSRFYTLTPSPTNVRIYSYKQIWHERMSKYIRQRKIDTNECPNIYSWLIYSNIRIFEYIRHTLQQTKGHCHLLSCSGQLKTQDFCTKMKFHPFYMIFRWAGAGQHYLVGFISLLSPQARGASVMSLLFQSVRKGISDKFMAIWGPRLRSSPAISTGQGHINIVITVSECL